MSVNRKSSGSFSWGLWGVEPPKESGGDSAELKEPRNLSRIRPEIFAFEPDLGLKLGQTKPKISGTVPERFWANFGVFRRRSETFKL